MIKQIKEIFYRRKEYKKLDKVRKVLVLLEETEYQEITSMDRLYTLRYYKREFQTMIDGIQKHLDKNIKED